MFYSSQTANDHGMQPIPPTTVATKSKIKLADILSQNDGILFLFLFLFFLNKYASISFKKGTSSTTLCFPQRLCNY